MSPWRCVYISIYQVCEAIGRRAHQLHLFLKWWTECINKSCSPLFTKLDRSQITISHSFEQYSQAE